MKNLSLIIIYGLGIIMPGILEKPEKLTLLNDEDFCLEQGMSMAEYARHRGVKRQAIFRHKRDGRLVLTTSGKINVQASDEKLGVVLDPSFREESNVPGGKRLLNQWKKSPFDEAKAKEKYYQAGIMELDYLERNGKLVLKKHMDEEAYETGRKFRNLVLRIPEIIVTEILSEFGIDVSVESIKKAQEIMCTKIKQAIQGF